MHHERLCIPPAELRVGSPLRRPVRRAGLSCDGQAHRWPMTGAVERPYGRCRYPLPGDNRKGRRSTALSKLKRKRAFQGHLRSTLHHDGQVHAWWRSATRICTVGDQLCAVKCVCVLGKRALERCMLW